MKKKTLKEQYANELLENNIEPYSVVRHSYTNNRLKGKRPIDTVQSKDRNISPTLDTRCDCLGVAVESVRLLGGFGKKCNKDTQYHEQNRIYDSECLATSIPANSAFHPNYQMNLRIRKLTPIECLKLMGFERKDEQAMREIGMTDSAIYHCAGDALITTLCAMLFATMLPMGEDTARQKVEKYIDSLVEK